jgi:hypothetical protein
MSEVFVDTSGWVALKHREDTFWLVMTIQKTPFHVRDVYFISPVPVSSHVYPAGNAGLWPASEAGGTPALPAKTATRLDDGR